MADAPLARESAHTSSQLAWFALLCAVFFCPQTLFAQNTQTAYSRFGVPEVLSPLGSLLWVKIPVEATDAKEDIAASSFSLGARPLNAAIPFLENGEVSFERQGTKYFLVIRSRKPVDELAIGVVVREQLVKGVRSREFTLLLDPPAIFEATQAERAIESTKIGTNAPLIVTQSQSIIPPETVAAPVPVVKAAQLPRAPRPSRASVAPLNLSPSSTISAVTTAKPAGRRPIRALAGDETQAEAPATTRKSRTGAPLRLSLSTQSLGVLPTASEATRAEIRRRQLTLDTDDLMSALLERNNRIKLLEAELASLAARVSAAESTLNINRPTPVSSPEAAMPVGATPSVPSVAAPVMPAPAASPAETPNNVVAPKTGVPSPASSVMSPAKIVSSSRFSSIWMAVLVVIALLSLGALAWWAIRRHVRARDELFRIVPKEVDAYEDVPHSQVPQYIAKTSASTDLAEETPAMREPLIPDEMHASSFPEIHFELPELEYVADVPGSLTTAVSPFAATEGTPATVFNFSANSANTESAIAPEDIRGRRTRYLQSRYQDIVMLNPPLDAPQRLLTQAGRIHDEGAADYAKRLLKYASYSRPATEEYWLALLEVLYRERFANDYLVNAKWFRGYHPLSKHWDEVQRIGYLLDPTAPIFASAAAWSHEEPTIGAWLPANLTDIEPVVERPELKLQLAD